MTILPKNEAAFSLVELMIAMFVLAIGIMATMAMQFSALAGYSASRDMTGATEVARAVEQRLRTEALQWQPGQTLTSNAVYAGEVALLSQMAGGAWVSLQANPVSVRLEGGASQRFCSFVRGELLGAMGDIEPEFIRATIAVVYAAANGQLPGVTQTTPSGNCDAIDSDLINPDDWQDLELAGMRVTFLSTAVQPR